MKRIDIHLTCLECGEDFTRKPHEIKRGRKTFCSRECSFAHGKPIEKKFWAKVHKTETCWFWTGTLNNKGYGETRLNNRFYFSHVASYELAFGPVPDGLIVRHKCDTPACVNPAHLSLGTQKDNMQDCKERGRTARGERSGASKMTEEKVREARSIYSQGGTTCKDIALRYGICPQAMGHILRRSTWTHV